MPFDEESGLISTYIEYAGYSLASVWASGPELRTTISLVGAVYQPGCFHRQSIFLVLQGFGNVSHSPGATEDSPLSALL
jgi:hypothetical protein